LERKAKIGWAKRLGYPVTEVALNPDGTRPITKPVETTADKLANKPADVLVDKPAKTATETPAVQVKQADKPKA
jgi:hypothetical protein